MAENQSPGFPPKCSFSMTDYQGRVKTGFFPQHAYSVAMCVGSHQPLLHLSITDAGAMSGGQEGARLDDCGGFEFADFSFAFPTGHQRHRVLQLFFSQLRVRVPPTFCCWLFGQLMSWPFGQNMLGTAAVSAREKENQTTSSVRHRRRLCIKRWLEPCWDHTEYTYCWVKWSWLEVGQKVFHSILFDLHHLMWATNKGHKMIGLHAVVKDFHRKSQD